MDKVDKHTRAGKCGKAIYCPKCNGQSIVYHFSWCGLQCSHCDCMVDKNEWLLKENPARANDEVFSDIEEHRKNGNRYISKRSMNVSKVKG